MSFLRLALFFLFFSLTVVGALAVLTAIMAPYIGLGSKEDYIFFQLANVTRLTSLLKGGLVFGLGVVGGFANIATSKDLSWTNRVSGRYFPVGRIGLWIRAQAGVVRGYFALPPRTTKYTFNRRDQLAIAFVAMIGVAIYSFKPLIFECDAAMFYNYARFLVNTSEGGFTFYRPPGFPGFLVATGQILFQSFNGTIITQAIMGLLMPVLLYRILAPISRPVALVIGFAFILSTIPFFAVKIMLATQLFLFLIVLSFYFYSRYYFLREPRYIPLIVLAALCAMFTRWEGVFALLVVIVAVAITARLDKAHRRLLGLSVMIFLVVLGSWTGARSIAYRDPALLFSLHGGTGQQFFWRLYQHMPLEIQAMEKAFGINQDSKQIGENSNVPTNLSGNTADGNKGIQLVNPENGPQTAKLAKIMEEFARNSPESYRNLKKPLDQAYRPPSQASRNYYDETFGRFDGQPEKMVENLFNNPNGFYPNYVFQGLVSTLGIAGADNLLRSVAWETLKNHWLISVSWLRQAFTFFGVSIQPLVNAIAEKSPPAYSPFFKYWGRAHYSKMVYDVGGCISGNLPEKMIAEIRDDNTNQPPHLIERSIDLGNFLRNFVRNLIGPIVLLTIWVLPFSPHRLLFIPIAITALAFIGGYGILAGGVYTRYEFPVQPLLLLLVGGSVIWIKDWVCRLFALGDHR